MERKELQKTITITQKQFLEAVARVTANEIHRDNTQSMETLMLYGMVGAELAKELFDKEETPKEAKDHDCEDCEFEELCKKLKSCK